MGLLEMLMRVHAQRDTPGGDQAIRPELTWQRIWGGDPGIYGKGAGRVGGDPVMPSYAAPFFARQMPIARNVVRDLERGVDPVLTGSGFEMSAEDYRRGESGSAFDMLQRYLREPQYYGLDRPKPTIPLFEGLR